MEAEAIGVESEAVEEIAASTSLVEKVRAEKIDLDDFVNEFDSRHDNRRIKLHCVDNDIKFKRSLCRDQCDNYIAHCLFA